MPNFVTLDDGISFIALSEIHSFGHVHDGDDKGETWIKLKDGHVTHTLWDVSKVAEILGPCANLHR